MKIEPEKVSKAIEQNYSFFAPDFFEMQTDYLNSMYSVYKDLDASLIVMLLTRKIYQEAINQDNSFGSQISVKSFYKEKKYNLPISKFKIKEISNALNLPRETIRRKKLKLIKDKFILFNKKKKTYSLNSEKIDGLIIKTQINISSKFLFNYCAFFSQKKIFLNDVTFDSFKDEINKKFLLYLPIFLNFQIYYFANWRKIIDMECLFISLLCALNTSSHIKKNSTIDNKIFNTTEIFAQLPNLSEKFGLNSTSIAEITKIPRTTVLRKLAKLEKVKLLKKDKFKRYTSQDLVNSFNMKKEYFATLQQTVKLLGIYVSECLEKYYSKDFKVN